MLNTSGKIAKKKPSSQHVYAKVPSWETRSVPSGRTTLCPPVKRSMTGGDPYRISPTAVPGSPLASRGRRVTTPCRAGLFHGVGHAASLRQTRTPQRVRTPPDAPRARAQSGLALAQSCRRQTPRQLRPPARERPPRHRVNVPLCLSQRTAQRPRLFFRPREESRSSSVPQGGALGRRIGPCAVREMWKSLQMGTWRQVENTGWERTCWAYTVLNCLIFGIAVQLSSIPGKYCTVCQWLLRSSQTIQFPHADSNFNEPPRNTSGNRLASSCFLPHPPHFSRNNNSILGVHVSLLWPPYMNAFIFSSPIIALCR